MSAPNNLSGADTDPAIVCVECGAQDVLYFGHRDGCGETVAESFARWERNNHDCGKGEYCPQYGSKGKSR